MRIKIKYALRPRRARNMKFRRVNAGASHRNIGRGMSFLGVVLMLSMFPAGKVLAAGQAGQSRDLHAQELDSRWSPWIGTWRLDSSTVNAAKGPADGRYILDIEPGEDRNSVVMKGSQDKAVLFDRKNVTVDGARRPLEDEGCEGWYKYSWSDTGKRLLFDSELTCPGNPPRIISGISLFADPYEWLDIQLLKSGEDRMITIRRYLETGDNRNISGERSAHRFARVAAGTNFSIDEIIELTDKVEPEVMEAALVEMHKPFEIDSGVLKRLADANVPSQVVDLMVALTFPDKFTVERRDAEPLKRPEYRESRADIVYAYAWSPFGMWAYCDPFFPAYWSAGWLYGYWGWGWPGYPIYIGRPGPGGGYRISGGRLVAGKGYARVQPGGPKGPRYAVPRGISGIINGATRSRSSAARTTTSGTRSGSRSVSGASRSSAGRSASASPSASSRGYSGGGGGGGRQARPRE